jgi:outer membrane receptor for ferrienterochelin and colicins
LSYDIPVLGYSTLQLNAGVQNIFNAYQKDFDTGAGRASDYIYGPGSPRSFFAGLKMTL